MSPIYNALKFTVGVLQNMQPAEQAGGLRVRHHLRHELRVRLRLPARQHGHVAGREGPAAGRFPEDGKPLAGHNFAIVDEVDSILIDEARTPLIISGAPEQAAELYVRFAKLAKTMEPGKRPEEHGPEDKKEFVADFDFEFDEKHKTVSILPSAAWPRPSASWGSTTSTAPRTARSSTTSTSR